MIRTTIRNNQKCFVVRDPQSAKLAPRFVLVSNMEATDGGKAIVAGNERVIRARLSDAKFFYETDLKTQAGRPVAEIRADRLSREARHARPSALPRIGEMAEWLAPQIDADLEKAKRAAKLAKADLLTEVVGEFPELQGLMGKYYALAQGEDDAVAHACEDHYKPAGAERPRARRSGGDCGRAGRQDRHPGRVSGRSTRSRPARKTPMRCAAPRWV